LCKAEEEKGEKMRKMKRMWRREIASHLPPTIVPEDNDACVMQMKTCYINNNITRYIS
jgi:hypothetical protein